MAEEAVAILCFEKKEVEEGLTRSGWHWSGKLSCPLRRSSGSLSLDSTRCCSEGGTVMTTVAAAGKGCWSSPHNNLRCLWFQFCASCLVSLTCRSCAENRCRDCYRVPRQSTA